MIVAPESLMPSAAELAHLDAVFPERTVVLPDGERMSVRISDSADSRAPVVVCLHGIGSGAASWFDVAQELGASAQVVAWAAPGYADSSPLPLTRPVAADYADRLRALLDALGIERCILVGHSLGALVVAAMARRPDAAKRLAAVLILSPARGYGGPGQEADRDRVHAGRMKALTELGIAGMAAQRSSRLLSEHASSTARAWVRWNMSLLNEGGYRQAVELLCGGHIFADLPPIIPVQVACGALDVVTPPQACRLVAQACEVELLEIPRAGHACYVEQPTAVAALIRDGWADSDQVLLRASGAMQ